MVDGVGEIVDGRCSPHGITDTLTQGARDTCMHQRVDKLYDHTDHNVEDRSRGFPIRVPSP